MTDLIKIKICLEYRSYIFKKYFFINNSFTFVFHVIFIYFQLHEVFSTRLTVELFIHLYKLIQNNYWVYIIYINFFLIFLYVSRWRHIAWRSDIWIKRVCTSFCTKRYKAHTTFLKSFFNISPAWRRFNICMSLYFVPLLYKKVQGIYNFFLNLFFNISPAWRRFNICMKWVCTFFVRTSTN